MNNEPVAWMIQAQTWHEFTFSEPDMAEAEAEEWSITPLYTHPAKTLTDEEIKDIWYDLYPLSSSSYWDEKRKGIAELKFARAILKKASEK